MDKNVLIARVDAYVKGHPPDTGYAKNAIRAVCAANLPVGARYDVQFALQFDGKETSQDLIKNAEWRAPYKASYSLDAGGDCIDICRNIIKATHGIWIGDWTEGVYKKWKGHQVPWSERREFDILLNKLGDRNDHATHGMLCIGGGFMLHTTSKGNPLRVDPDTKYPASTRTGTGVFRVLSDKQYESMFVTAPTPTETTTYTVQRGDNLTKISQKFNVTIAQLMVWNPIIKKPNMIQPGWVLTIKASEHYVVKGDDTLGKIALRYHVSIPKLMELNPFIKDKNLIRPGWVIRLR